MAIVAAEWITIKDQVDFMDLQGNLLVTLQGNKEYLGRLKGDKYIIDQDGYELEVGTNEVLKEEN